MNRVIAFASTGLTVDDIDVFEINEAFASQVRDSHQILLARRHIQRLLCKQLEIDALFLL